MLSFFLQRRNARKICLLIASFVLHSSEIRSSLFIIFSLLKMNRNERESVLIEVIRLLQINATFKQLYYYFINSYSSNIQIYLNIYEFRIFSRFETHFQINHVRWVCYVDSTLVVHVWYKNVNTNERKRAIIYSNMTDIRQFCCSPFWGYAYKCE